MLEAKIEILSKKIYEYIYRFKICFKMNKKGREILNNPIDKFFLNDLVVTKYYNDSLDALVEFYKRNKYFPTYKEWNKYAYENKYLSHISIEYISSLKWHSIKKFISIK